ncbi:MAG: heavy metal translocating P-type ATPase [Bacillales bacterium]|nr:heavy metal translocating P-type ATPase [Bacillales bacterium]
MNNRHHQHKHNHDCEYHKHHHHDEEECCYEHHHHHEEECSCHNHQHENDEECECHDHHHHYEDNIEHHEIDEEINDKNVIISEFQFEEIDCPNCANKIEIVLNKHKDIIEASVIFLDKKIRVKHQKNIDAKVIVKNILKETEPDAYLVEENEKQEGFYRKKEHKIIIKRVLFILGVILFVIGCVILHLGDETINNNLGTKPIIQGNMYLILLYVSFIGSYVFLAYDVIYKSINGIIHKDVFNESLLMVIASLGAIVLSIISPEKEFFEGCAVILFYKIGEFLQEKATESTTSAIKGLLEIKVDTVTLVDGTIKAIKDVHIGEKLIIKVGERVALDGVLLSNEANIDMRTLTGESVPVLVRKGEEILSGSINMSNVIELEVTRENENSTITKVKKLVQEASSKKSKSEQFIAKFARIYTPIVLLIAIFVGVLEGFTGIGLDSNLPRVQSTLNNVFSILVISCPCSLVISIPLAYFAGMGNSSKHGILIKGGNYLEALTNVKEIVFDKTGTITKGNFKVVDICPNGITKEELLELASSVEQYSSHPIAQSILLEFGQNKIELSNDVSIEEISGEGIKMICDKEVTLVGNEKLMNRFGIDFIINNEVGSILYVAKNNIFLGSIAVRDEIKDNSYKLFNKLNKKHINTTMLTGDKRDFAQFVANEVGIKEVHYELLPQEKYAILEDKISKKTGTIVYVGDGINDTPSLSRADVGIALGGIGSDSAKEVADVVIMNDDIDKVDTIINISKNTKKIIYENVIFIIAMKIIALVVSSAGWLGSYAMLLSIFADVGVCLLCILNSLRVLYHKVK